MVQSRRRPKVTAHTCWASVGAMPAGDQLTGTWPGQMQRLSTVVPWSCRRHESNRTRGAAEAGCSGRGLFEQGPPFNPAECGLARHAVYLSAGEVVFVPEGDEVEWIVNEIVNEPFGAVAEALGTLRELVEDSRIARTVYT
jgi:hypothetical protein